MAHKNFLGYLPGRQRWACSECGNEVETDAQHCSSCGASFQETSVTNDGASSAAHHTYTGTFHGEGIELFGTILLNAILTILTLGIYAAWGKAKIYQFFYDNTEFAGSHFQFNGTGKEIFLGYLKAVVIFIGIYFLLAIAFMIAAQIGGIAPLIAILGWYALIAYLAHYAMYSSRRYRFSRTTFRKIRFRLEGAPVDFANQSFLNLLLSILTVGFYLPVYYHRQFAYIYDRLRFGNVAFRYSGEEREFYKIALSGFFLTVLTLGVYYFWWYPKMYNYYIQHLHAGDGKFHTEIRPGEFFELMIVNLLLTVFTLGLGIPWVQVRTAKFFIEHLRLEGAFDVDSVVQTAQQAASAGGEGLTEALDMDVDLGF